MGKGGGGAPQPTSTTAYQTNLPEYAKPYVMNMLGAAQNQLFTTTPGADGQPGEITGFKPYTPYSTDPTQYFAGPSSLQRSVYNEAGQMQTPSQFAPATGLAGIAGQQALGTQGQSQGLMNTALGYGQAGAGYGQAGQLYGAQGAAEAQQAAQQAQRAASMYGLQGSMYGAQAAGLAPQAQAYGQGAANIGMQGLGYGAQGAGFGQQAANMAGMGFGAGQQFAQQATDPRAVQAYMSPYQQAVTDVAKNAAIREAQLAQQATNLGSARQGTYGGARQALMQGERERNLLANLSNIQAQGSQSAFDKAMQTQQFGANLGLQGLSAGYQGLGMGMQGAQTGLQGLGTAMQGQQAGVSALGQAGSLYGQGMQGAGVGLSGVGQQLGAGQLGLQGTAQGIQGAQAGMQGAGVGLSGVGQALGAGQYGLQGLGQATQAASTLGQLGSAEQQADLARMGFQQQTGAAQQQYQQNIINQAIQDFATAQQYPYMQLSTMSNLLRGLPMQSMSTQQYQAQPSSTQQLLGLAGTGASLYGAMGRKEGGTIKEYAAGGGVKASLENKIDDIADAGGAKGLQALFAQTKSPAAKELIMERMREEGIGAAPTGGLGRNMAGGGIVAFAAGDLVDDPLAQFSGISPESMAMDQMRIDEEKRKKAVQQYNFLKDASPVAAARMLANDPSLEPKPAAVAAAPATAANTSVPPAAAPAAPTSAAQEYTSPTGLAAVLEQRRKLLGVEGPGEKSEAFMKALEERQAGLGKQNESDRYLRAAEAFAKFGSTAGPIGRVASEALGGFAKGEAAARKDQDKMQLEGMKMQADLEKARRAEARGDLDAAEKFYTSAEDRKAAMARVLAAGGKEEQLIERAMKDPKFMEALRTTKGLDSKAQQAALVNYTKWESSASLTDPALRKLIKAAKDGDPKAVQALNDYKENVYNQFLTRAGGSASPMGVSNVQLNKDQQALLDKYK